MLYAKNAKKTETEETIGFFVTFLSLMAFQLGGPGLLDPPGYAYEQEHRKFSERYAIHNMQVLFLLRQWAEEQFYFEILSQFPPLCRRHF